MLIDCHRQIIRPIVLTVVIGLATIMVSYAQHVSSKNRFKFDHEAYATNNLELGPREMTSGIMGDFINLDNGELSFSQLDAEILGNFDIPVEIRRFIDSDNDRPKFTTSEKDSRSTGTANWGLELPHILLQSITQNGTVGCLSTSNNLEELDKMYVVPRLFIDRKNRWTLLKSSSTYSAKTLGSSLPDYTVSSMWRVNQTKKNGKCSWQAVGPNGHVYEFDQPYILEKRFDGARKHAVLITKITDVHGNWVKFSYDSSHKRLTKITSSDNRTITLIYRSNNELECIIVNGRIWVYNFKSIYKSANSPKYLSKVMLPDGRYWEFDQLKGITYQKSSFHSQRCMFGKGARVRHYTGAIATYKTKKIVNFFEANSTNGHLNTSQRAECLPPVDFYDTVIEDAQYYRILNSNMYLASYGAYQYKRAKILQAMKSASLADGTSKYGKFSTLFSSAVTEKKLESPDGTTITWTYEYGEGDLYNGDYSEKTSKKSVHKNGKVVLVDTSVPKKRTATGPLGIKYEFNFGRSLNSTGALISELIYPKGSSKAVRNVEYEYLHSASPVGLAWNRVIYAQKGIEHWRRVSKRKITQDGEVYRTTNSYDGRGSLTKTVADSSIKINSRVMKREVLHLTSKWILDLTSKITVSGKEMRAFTRDAFGSVTLEKRYGRPFQRNKWNSDGTLAASRTADNKTTKYENYKRGIVQKLTKPSGAVFTKVIDRNGWVTSETDFLGYTESYAYDKVGRVTSIDRPTGYADSTITYSAASATSNRSKSVATGTGKQKIIEKTSYNIFNDELLFEMRDVSNSTSVFVRSEFDELGRKSFESFPDSTSSATTGINVTFDAMGRSTVLQLSVSPSTKVGISYLSDNRIRITDASGNVTVKHRSGYGTPDDGKITLIEYPDGTKTSVTHDSWQNVTALNFSGVGRTLTRSFKYDSTLSLCMQSIPELGTEAFTFNAVGQRITSEKGVSSAYACPTPISVSINEFAKTTKPTTPTAPTTPSTPTTPTTTNPSGNCYSYMVWVPSYNKCMNAGIVRQCGEWILTSPTKNGCIYNPACAVRPNYSYYPPLNYQSYTFQPSTNPSCNNQTYANSTSASDPIASSIVRYGYNSDGLLTSIDFPDDTPDITNTYDLAGNLIKTVSGSIVNTYTYGKRGELKSETLTVDNEIYRVSYGYNSTGGRTSYKSPGGKALKFTLNAFNQVTAISIGSVKYVSSATYHPNGVLKSAKLHNTKSSENSLTRTLKNELNSRSLIQVTTFANMATGVFEFSNTYFKDGRLKTVVDTLNVSATAGNRTFTYNSKGNVKSAKDTSVVTNYTIDGFSNILSQVNTDRSIVLNVDQNSNRVNQLTRTKTISGARVSTTQTISHDSFGRVTSLRGMNLAYDSADRLVSAKLSGKFEDFSYYDGNHNRAKFIEKNLESSLSQKRHLFYSVEGPLLSQIAIVPSSSTKKQYSDLVNFDVNLTLHLFSCTHWIYHSNTNNYVIALNPDNSISTTTSIGPFGTTWASDEEANPCDSASTGSGIVASAFSQNSNSSRRKNLSNHLFRNVQRDQNTKLYFLGSKRFYGALGRYITPDSPIKWGNRPEVDIEKGNLYSIANNDPINAISPQFNSMNELLVRLNRPEIVSLGHEFESYFQR